MPAATDMACRTVSRCLTSPDAIVVYDGKDLTARVIAQFCNTHYFVELLSTGPDMMVEFVSRSQSPGQGFKASYHFEEELHYAEGGPSSELLQAWLSSCASTPPILVSCSKSRQSSGNYRRAIVHDARPRLWLRPVVQQHSIEKRDVLEPRLPRQLPRGHSLHLPLQRRRHRKGAGCLPRLRLVPARRLVPHVRGGGRRDLCSSRSTDNATGARETRLPEDSGQPIQFVTDFGITSGKQDTSFACGFAYNSSDSTNGSFASPNWPGIYPRDTECHYFFYGVPGEKVFIEFAYFDIEGLPPCTAETASDYVEFSSARRADHKIPRHCGMQKPPNIESEGEFFRVTFRTNDRFDGTGFSAQYQFRSVIDPYTIKRFRGGATSLEGCTQIIALVILVEFLRLAGGLR
ncbi:hypothetical protein MTO96_005345 [Rhipicephalus appendiculatus]